MQLIELVQMMSPLAIVQGEVFACRTAHLCLNTSSLNICMGYLRMTKHPAPSTCILNTALLSCLLLCDRQLE